nr:MAG TPA: hypothetical protein [Caudoviricetes sp.]
MKGLDAPNGAIAYANATAMMGRRKDSRITTRKVRMADANSGPPDARGIAANKLIREPKGALTGYG